MSANVEPLVAEKNREIQRLGRELDQIQSRQSEGLDKKSNLEATLKR